MKRYLKVVLDIKIYDSKDKIKILDIFIKLNQYSEIVQCVNEFFEIIRELYFKYIEVVSFYNI